MTFAGAAFGLASRRYMLKNPPVRPSATNQLVAGDPMAAASWPPFQRRPGVLPKYMERSTVIGCVLVIDVENARPFTPGMSLANTVRRAFAGTVYVRVTGPPESRR